MGRTRGFHKQKRRVKKDGTPDLRYSGSMAKVCYETYEKELAYLRRKRYAMGPKGYLPTPEEIEDLKQVIRQENDERDRLNDNLEEVKVKTHNLSVKTYRIDPSGQGGRHGKVI